VVMITLIPFEFRMPRTVRIFLVPDFKDFITNIVLFIPVGFLFRLSRGKCSDPFCLTALVFGMLLSLAIESAQVFIAGRYPQVSDVLLNGSGAWLGAMLFRVLKKNLKAKQPFKLFALELPLMSLVYLLVPLMWLNSLATGKEGSRLWLMLLLGLMGGGVLSAIYRFRFKQPQGPSFYKLSFFAMAWFLIASIPAMINFPKEMSLCGIFIGIFVQIPARIPGRTEKDERRFELPTLKLLLPVYAVYLLLLAAWPTTLPLEQWRFGINFEELVFNEKIVFIFRFIEYVAAFTLLGYMIAEMRGRKNESTERTLVWTLFIATIAAIFIEMLKTYPAIRSFSILSIIIIASASIYGAVTYRLQLSSIERLDPFTH
jgi:glycopeptide antibiotics resistance protein